MFVPTVPPLLSCRLLIWLPTTLFAKSLEAPLVSLSRLSMEISGRALVAEASSSELPRNQDRMSHRRSAVRAVVIFPVNESVWEKGFVENLDAGPDAKVQMQMQMRG